MRWEVGSPYFASSVCSSITIIYTIDTVRKTTRWLIIDVGPRYIRHAAARKKSEVDVSSSGQQCSSTETADMHRLSR